MRSGTLPAGRHLYDTDGGTATLAGTPSAGSGGSYPLVFTASNAAGSPTQSFTLTVNQPAAITSANNTTFTVGTNGSLQSAASGFPTTYTFTSTGTALPSGVTLSSGGLLSGTPAAGTGGIYNLTFMASNGVAPDGTQSFTLTVNEAPHYHEREQQELHRGASGGLSAEAPGFPTSFTFTNTGAALPSGVTLMPSGLLSGTPAAGTGGVYNLTFKASNGIAPDATQSFTLTVNQTPAFTSAAERLSRSARRVHSPSRRPGSRRRRSLSAAPCPRM